MTDRDTQELVKRARDYLEQNAAESGADVLIDELTVSLNSMSANLGYAYAVIRSGFEFGTFDFSVLKDRAEHWRGQ